MKLYRDGLEEEIDGGIKVKTTRDGHVVECYSVGGTPRYFVTLYGSHRCAHGSSVADAVASAIWKDPSKRPSTESLVAEVRAAGRKRRISLNEFMTLTGACREGCRIALARAGLSGEPMLASEIRDKVSKEWGDKLLQILGWEQESKHEKE